MGEIDEKFVYEASLPWKSRNVNLKLKLAKDCSRSCNSDYC